MGDGALFLDEELLLARGPLKVPCRSEGQRYDVGILAFALPHDLENHPNRLKAPSIVAGVVSGSLDGQEGSLVQRDVAKGLPCRVELDLLLFLPFLIDHGRTLWCDVR